MASSDFNTTNGGDRSVEFLPLEAHKLLSRDTSESYPNNGEGGATAKFEAECSIVTNTPTSAVTLLDMSGSLLAHCGKVSGTGAQPGGGSAIYPSWKTDLHLPGNTKKDEWSVKVSFANNLSELQKSDVSCSVAVDTDSRNFSVGQKNEISFELEPGNHPLRMKCIGPPDGPPWRRGYDQCLGPRGITKTMTVTLPLEVRAERHRTSTQRIKK